VWRQRDEYARGVQGHQCRYECDRGKHERRGDHHRGWQCSCQPPVSRGDASGNERDERGHDHDRRHDGGANRDERGLLVHHR
jgi:hypothetical protein